MRTADEVRRAFGNVLGELLDGAGPDTGWALNPGDRGLLASLDGLPASAANARPGGRSSIAAHVDHLRYGLQLMNRWAGGEKNPFADADYSASWRKQEVSDGGWRELRDQLAQEARAWLVIAQQPRDVTDDELTGIVASIVHLAYHLGAIRQIDAATRGPLAGD